MKVLKIALATAGMVIVAASVFVLLTGCAAGWVGVAGLGAGFMALDAGCGK